jgi:hypothetical protein
MIACDKANVNTSSAAAHQQKHKYQISINMQSEHNYVILLGIIQTYQLHVSAITWPSSGCTKLTE